MSRPPLSFAEFWPYYLRQHSAPATRHLHIIGTGIALVSLAAFAVTRRPVFAATALTGSYGPAWFSHAAIEKNEPATFKHPLWSLLADFKMFGLWASGKLDLELAEHNVVGPHRATAATKR